MKPYWVSWWHQGHDPFTLHSPWWPSGFRSEHEVSIVAAVRAGSPEQAQRVVLAAYEALDDHRVLEWRFVEEKPADFSPFSARFPRGDWMRW